MPSVEEIDRALHAGWLLRFLHANAASFFFVWVYLHIATKSASWASWLIAGACPKPLRHIAQNLSWRWASSPLLIHGQP